MLLAAIAAAASPRGPPALFAFPSLPPLAHAAAALSLRPRSSAPLVLSLPPNILFVALPLANFSLILAFAPPFPNQHAVLRSLIEPAAAALDFLQKSSCFVSQQLALIQSLKDNPSSTPFMARALASSSLASSIASLFFIASGLAQPHTSIHSVPIAFDTSAIADQFIQQSSQQTQLESRLSECNLRPYHALLLLCDPEDILRSLPPDASPLLIELIQIITPFQSLSDLQSALSCTLASIYKLASHLIFWKKAKPIHTISPRNVYTVSPSADLANIAPIASEFASKFPPLDLIHILNQLSSPRPYSAIAPSKDSRNLYLEIITFLLRKNLVVQLHMYIYLVIPSSIIQSNASIDQPAPAPVISNLSSPSPQEQAWISAIANSQPHPFSAIFLKLVPYFNGKLNVEEILYRESISRKELKAIISRFKNEVITTLHSEPEIF